jgi:hypothetical protein
MFYLTGGRWFDNFKKFAPKRSTPLSDYKSATEISVAHQVRGQTEPMVQASIQGFRSGGSPSRIFDKLVERASREMRSGLA